MKNAFPPPESLDKDDVAELVALEKLCFSVPWSAKQYATVMDNDPFHVVGLRLHGELAGYLTFFAAAWEMEVLNIAVRPDLRRRGIGRQLLGHVLQLCRSMGMKRGYLEVRRSNVAARTLYEAFGFEEVGLRKRYYPDNQEDAIVMRLELGEDPDSPQTPAPAA
ncbi:ribosomal protein S18-alanine N-acetyltransferase [Fundidesulfovibrio butyratiphilus]